MAAMNFDETIANLPKGELWRDYAIRAQKGDQRAYAALLRDLLPYIKSVIGAGLANPDWVEDIAQEVLISLHKSLATYSADRPFKPWLQSIIHFRKTDFLRQHYKARKIKEGIKIDSDTFSKNVTDTKHSGEFKDIEEALETLPDQQQKIFKMMKIEGYSAKEIANQMGMTESAVKVSAHRSQNKIIGYLKDHG